jgi:hypothetical protein
MHASHSELDRKRLAAVAAARRSSRRWRSSPPPHQAVRESPSSAQGREPAAAKTKPTTRATCLGVMRIDRYSGPRSASRVPESPRWNPGRGFSFSRVTRPPRMQRPAQGARVIHDSCRPRVVPLPYTTVRSDTGPPEALPQRPRSCLRLSRAGRPRHTKHRAWRGAEAAAIAQFGLGNNCWQTPKNIAFRQQR